MHGKSVATILHDPLQQEEKKTSPLPESSKELKQLEPPKPKQERYPLRYAPHRFKYSPENESPEEINRNYEEMLNQFWNLADQFFPKFRTLFSHLAYFFASYFQLTEKDQHRLIHEVKNNLPDYFIYHFPTWIIHLLSKRSKENPLLKFLLFTVKIVWDIPNLLGPHEIALYELFKHYPDKNLLLPYIDKIFEDSFVGVGYDPTDYNKMASWKPSKNLLELILARELELKGDPAFKSYFIGLIYQYCQLNYSIKIIPPKVQLQQKEQYSPLQHYLDLRRDPKKSESLALYESWPYEINDLRTHKRRIGLFSKEQERNERFREWIIKYPHPFKSGE